MDQHSPHNILTTVIITLISIADFSKATNLCPSQCRCKPGIVNENIVEVQCQGLTDLPISLPQASSYRLIFTSNQIKTLESRSYLLNTDYLDLSDNQIVNVTRTAIRQLMHSVRYLYLQGNQIQCMPLSEEDFNEHVNVVEADFSDNPWQCDCFRNVLKLWESHSDHRTVLKHREKLMCGDYNSSLHIIEQEPRTTEPSSKWSSIFSKNGAVGSLTKRNGFYACVATLSATMVIIVALAIVYLYRHKMEKRTYPQNKDQNTEDTQPII